MQSTRLILQIPQYHSSVPVLQSGTKCHLYHVMGESRTASLQHASAPPLPFIWKSLSRGSRRWPSTAHSADHLFAQGSAPAVCFAQAYISLGAGQSTSPLRTLGWCVPGRERLSASPHLCLLLRPPALSPGKQKAALSGPCYGPWVAQEAYNASGWDRDVGRETERQRSGGLCCGSNDGPVAELERACRLPSLAPVHRARQPLPLVTCPHISWTSFAHTSAQFIITFITCVDENQTGRLLLWLTWKKKQLSKRQRWEFWEGGKQFWYLAKRSCWFQMWVQG